MVNISAISIKEDAGELLVSANIEMPDISEIGWFRLPLGSETDEQAAADAFYIIGLVCAMGTDGKLTMDVPVSKNLLYSSKAFQDVFVKWYPKRLGRVEVNVEAREEDSAPVQGKTISCFTGGVDSFDTFINNREDIDALLYVHGFDIGLARTKIREATSKHLIAVGAETGKEIIQPSTNIRVFLNRSATWSIITHGAALAAVGHLLSGRFSRLIIPASHTYSDSYAWGSHPLTDHLWSTFRLMVIHDGAGSTRVQKTQNLAYDDAARHHLRVCWQNTGKYNCGECIKCTRTMMALRMAGVLEEFKTFEHEIPMDIVRAQEISNLSGRSFVVENLAYAKEVGDVEIAEILAQQIKDFDAKRAVTKSAKSTDPVAKRLAALEKLTAGQARQIEAIQSGQKNLGNRINTVSKRVKKVESLFPLRAWRKLRGK